MTNSTKIVTEIPLKNIWNDSKEIFAKREKILNKRDISEILAKYPVEFAIANIGEKLEWINVNQCYNYWKTKIINQIIENPNKIELEKLPNEYGFLASLWTGEIEIPIILLEKYH